MPTEELKMPSYGGQALIEGVLMRGANSLAAAFRTPDGKITIQSEALTGIYKSKLAKIPFLRGLVMLWDALGLGTRYLTISANLQVEDEKDKIEGGSLALTLVVSLGIAILLFFVAPAALGHWIGNSIGASTLVNNLFEGLIRLVFLILYIWGIGRMKDVARVFSYHGAEHKTINAFEAGVELTPENVQKFSLQHPRCGTGFLLIVVVFSVLVFSLVGKLLVVWLVLSRILLVPPIAMIAYEYMRWSSRHLDNPIVRFIVKPNLALQNLTTREPTLDILEVAIAAFNAMKEEEEKATV